MQQVALVVELAPTRSLKVVRAERSPGFQCDADSDAPAPMRSGSALCPKVGIGTSCALALAVVVRR